VNTKLNQMLDTAEKGTRFVPNFIGGGGEFKADLPGGVSVVIKPHKKGDGFFIEGHDDQEHLTKDQVIKYLDENGYFSGTAAPTLSPEELKIKEKTDSLMRQYSKK